MFRKRIRAQQIKMLSIIAVGVLTLSIGFAAFSSILTINSTAIVTPDSGEFSIKFSSSNTELKTDGIPAVATGKASGEDAIIMNSINPTITGLNADFTAPGESVSYTFYVRNDGAYLAYLTSIVFENAFGADSIKSCVAEEGTSASLVADACNGINIKLEIDGITATETELGIKGSTLAVEESKEVVVTISYDENAARSDGPFNIDFGNIYLSYGTIETDEFPVLPNQSYDVWDGISVTSYENLIMEETSKTIQINSAADLAGFRDAVNEGKLKGYNAVLNTSVDLAGYAWTPIGTNSSSYSTYDSSLAYYEGTFEGNGYTISNVNVQTTGTEAVGFFGGVAGDVTIKNLNIAGGKISSAGKTTAGLVAYSIDKTDSPTNLTIERVSVDVEVTGADAVSGIIARAYNSGVKTVVNCENHGNITGPGNVYNTGKVAGIVSLSNGSTLVIRDSQNYGNVTNGWHVGGILGYVNLGTYNIYNCSNYGTIGTATDTDYAYNAGGIVGVVNFGSSVGKATNCTNNGSVAAANYAGGIIGVSSRNWVVDACVNNEDITGSVFAGGIVGALAVDGNIGMKITNSHNTAAVTCSAGSAGGIVSHMQQGSISGSSNTGTIIANNWAGGIIGRSVEGDITDCENSGKIISTGTTEHITDYDYLEMYAAGGIAGSNHGSGGTYVDSIITDSRNSGEIEAVIYSGGIVGISVNDSTIEGSHNTGAVTSTKKYAGGVTGYAFIEGQHAGQKLQVNSCSGGTSTITSTNPGRLVGSIFAYDNNNVEGGVYITLSSNNDSRDIDIIGDIYADENHTTVYLIGTVPEWINGQPHSSTVLNGFYNSNISIYYNGVLTWGYSGTGLKEWTIRP